jgi:hypothetical protein
MRCKVADYELDPFIEGIASELRRPVQVDARFDDRVMAALDAPTVIPIHQARPRTWSERRWTVSITPMGGMVAAAALFMIALAGAKLVVDNRQAGTPLAVTSDSIQMRNVANVPGVTESMIVEKQFTVLVPGVKSVAIVGDFNDWDVSRTKMQLLSPNGLWSVTLPLRIGRHEYQFVVDDTLHITDPTAPESSSDFGSANSVVTVTRRDP